VEQSG